MKRIPCLILICGIGGSGKTTIAKELSKQIKNSIYIDKDILQDPFTKSRCNHIYESIREKTYEGIYNLSIINLLLGKDVIIDAPHVKQMQDEIWKEKIKNIAKKGRSRIKVVWCYASENEVKRRLRKRGLKRDLNKLKNWKEFLKSEPIKVAIPFDHIYFNTEKDDISKILDFLKIKNHSLKATDKK